MQEKLVFTGSQFDFLEQQGKNVDVQRMATRAVDVQKLKLSKQMKLLNPVPKFQSVPATPQFFDLASHDITNFKATRGSATHFWWSQPLDNGFRWRIGMVEQTHKYKKGFIGAPTASNNKDTTVYSNFRLGF